MERLFSEFNEITYKEWKNKVNFELLGDDYNSTMVWNTLEGINIPAFLSKDYDYNYLEFDLRKSDKTKGAKIFHLNNSPKSINILKNLLNEKIDSLVIYVPKDYNLETLRGQVSKVNFDIQFNFEEFDPKYIPALNSISSKLSKGKQIYLNLDPLSEFLERGRWKSSYGESIALLKDVLHKLNSNIIALSIKSDLYQNAGANASQQIATALACAVEYADKLGGSILNRIQYRFAIGGNFFIEIAKIDAFKLLIKNIKKEYGIKGYTEIYAESSLRNKSLYSAHNNLLRSGTECFAALLAGADTFLPYPHDYIFNHPNSSSSRLAYNQINILRDEAYVDMVSNPLEGSYYYEFVRSELSKVSLELFKWIENGGGFYQMTINNNIQKKIIESSKKEQKLFDLGNLSIVGANAQLDLDEMISDKIKKYPFRKPRNEKADIVNISKIRLSEKIEKERLNMESSLNKR